MATGAALLILGILYARWQHGEIRRTPGIRVPEEPYQTETTSQAGWELNGLRIKPLANIRLRARVIHTERYWFDAASRVSPIDIVLGWGAMSDQNVVDQISFSQGQRWYYWRPKGSLMPVPTQVVIRNSANMHMIPSSDKVKTQLRSLRPGHIVTLYGDLVSVESKEGWRWRSSLSRTDVGAGACELVWVRALSFR